MGEVIGERQMHCPPRGVAVVAVAGALQLLAVALRQLAAMGLVCGTAVPSLVVLFLVSPKEGEIENAVVVVVVVVVVAVVVAGRPLCLPRRTAVGDDEENRRRRGGSGC